MTSNIDITKPTAGQAFTVDVRDNFSTAASEITALQTALATAQNDIATLKARQQTAASLISASPPNTASTAFVIAGIGFQFTPTNEKREIVMLDGQLGNTGNANASDLQIVFGQGSAPAAGTLVTATSGAFVGNLVNILTARAGDLKPFALSTLLTGLTSGQQYWIDAAYRAESGTATLSQMSLTIFEILDPAP